MYVSVCVCAMLLRLPASAFACVRVTHVDADARIPRRVNHAEDAGARRLRHAVHASSPQKTSRLRAPGTTARVCAPHLLEKQLDPDAAWRRNEPLPIKHGPLLFDFKWLPKPQLVPSKAEAAAANGSADGDSGAAQGAPAASSLAGKKRKAAEEPTANGAA